MRVVGLSAALVLAAGCTFDGDGLSSAPPEADPSLDGGGGVAPDAALSSPDAARPDATPDCVDEDDDGYVVSATGVYCGEALDCDDSDPRVHPDQTAYFSNQRNKGGFDFDCDGRETPIDGALGEGCHTDWFDCEGTGWLDQVPACGEEGVYHVCEAGFLSCDEALTNTTEMSCR